MLTLLGALLNQKLASLTVLDAVLKQKITPNKSSLTVLDAVLKQKLTPTKRSLTVFDAAATNSSHRGGIHTSGFGGLTTVTNSLRYGGVNTSMPPKPKMTSTATTNS